jgi:hypothetical protein
MRYNSIMTMGRTRSLRVCGASSLHVELAGARTVKRLAVVVLGVYLVVASNLYSDLTAPQFQANNERAETPVVQTSSGVSANPITEPSLGFEELAKKKRTTKTINHDNAVNLDKEQTLSNKNTAKQLAKVKRAIQANLRNAKLLAKEIPKVKKAIQEIKDTERRKYFEHLINVTLSDSPTRAAGRWVNKPPSLARPESDALLQCLDKERQGNCHDDAAKLSAIRIEKQNVETSGGNYRVERLKSGGNSRLKRLNKVGSIENSPSILAGYDPYIWESDDEAYAVLPPGNGTRELRQALQGRKLFLIGDSLTRQWAQVLQCELKHAMGDTDDTVRLCEANEFPSGRKLDDCLKSATSRDFIVFNFGHHQDPGKFGMAGTWVAEYMKVMTGALGALSTKFGHLPSDHIFFRTTSVRHYWFGTGDWNSKSWQIGGVAANMDAKWKDYGGLAFAQPLQNLIGLSMVATQSNFSVLDVSPLMLARADASFDGSHFCMPGPMDQWSRMLYYRILQMQ